MDKKLVEELAKVGYEAVWKNLGFKWSRAGKISKAKEILYVEAILQKLTDKGMMKG